jgi:hypothetical protein
MDNFAVEVKFKWNTKLLKAASAGGKEAIKFAGTFLVNEVGTDDLTPGFLATCALNAASRLFRGASVSVGVEFNSFMDVARDALSWAYNFQIQSFEQARADTTDQQPDSDNFPDSVYGAYRQLLFMGLMSGSITKEDLEQFTAYSACPPEREGPLAFFKYLTMGTITEEEIQGILAAIGGINGNFLKSLRDTALAQHYPVLDEGIAQMVGIRESANNCWYLMDPLYIPQYFIKHTMSFLVADKFCHPGGNMCAMMDLKGNRLFMGSGVIDGPRLFKSILGCAKGFTAFSVETTAFNVGLTMKGMDIVKLLPSVKQLEDAKVDSIFIGDESPESARQQRLIADLVRKELKRMPVPIRMLVNEVLSLYIGDMEYAGVTKPRRATVKSAMALAGAPDDEMDFAEMGLYWANKILPAAAYTPEELAEFQQSQPEFMQLLAAFWPMIDRFQPVLVDPESDEFQTALQALREEMEGMPGAEDPAMFIGDMFVAGYDALDNVKRIYAKLAGLEYESQISSWTKIGFPVNTGYEGKPWEPPPPGMYEKVRNEEFCEEEVVVCMPAAMPAL